MILSTVLGGNIRTSVVICASSNQTQAAERSAALKLGESCDRYANAILRDYFLKQHIDNADAPLQNAKNVPRRKVDGS